MLQPRCGTVISSRRSGHGGHTSSLKKVRILASVGLGLGLYRVWVIGLGLGLG